MAGVRGFPEFFLGLLYSVETIHEDSDGKAMLVTSIGELEH